MKVIESIALAVLAVALSDGASAAGGRGEVRRELPARQRVEREQGRDASAPQASAAKPGAVAGTVVHPDGRPATGVLVTAIVSLAEEEHSVPDIFTATTDDRGAFVIPSALPVDEDWDVTVTARASGFALETTRVKGKGGAGVDSLRMALEPAQAVKLRFVDARRAPVEGVTVFTQRRVTSDGQDNFVPLAGADRMMQFSGADGVVELHDFSPGDRVTLGVLAPGRRWEMRSFVADASTELILAPAPNGGVAGHVRGEDGKPIARADVMLIATTWTGATTAARPFATRTRPDGSFTTRDVCPLGERYGLLVSASANGLAFESRETLEELGAPAAAHDFALGPAEPVRLRVVDAAGRPVAGARVCPVSRVTPDATTHVVPVQAAARITRVTDAKGMVTLDCFAHGDAATVQVALLGTKPSQAAFRVGEQGLVEVKVTP